MAVKSAAPPADVRVDTEVPGEIRRDQYGRPVIGGKAYTRASTFGGCLEDTFGVDRWAKGMIVYGMGKREDLRMRAAAVEDPDSEEGKRELRRIQEEAYTLSGADRKAGLGTALHALTDQLDRGFTLASQGRFDPILDRYVELMAGFRVLLSEVFTVCERWSTAGTFDDLVEPKGWLAAPDGEVFGPGTSLIVDKKTSASSRYFGAKFACQLRTYRDGEVYDRATGTLSGWAGHPTPSPHWALILHLPSDPNLIEDAGWYWVDLRRGEELCELALAVRKVRWEKNLIVPARSGVTPQHPDAMRKAGCLSKIADAHSLAALKMIARSHAAIWDDELRAAARARADVIGASS